MLENINRVFLALLMLLALAGMLISVAALFLPDFLEEDAEFARFGHMGFRQDFSIEHRPGAFSPDDSPFFTNLTIHTPPLLIGDNLSLDVFFRGERIYSYECLDAFDSPEGYYGLVELACEAALPYDYEPGGTYRVFATLSRGDKEYAAGPAILEADWRQYEEGFIGFSWVLGSGILLAYLAIILPLAFLALKVASGMKHDDAEAWEYSLESLAFPLRKAKTLLQMFHSFLVSPYFWAFESIGIAIILLYMAVASEAWKSMAAFIGFAFSGLMAFIVPFVWSVAWWYADYREREPLRIIVTMFLWGMLAALMVIGINTIADAGLYAIGLAALGTFLIAPIVEELFKGSGLTLLSEHHEFDSVEDGLVFGFVIGMGFSFIENWIYFLGNPLGSDTAGWFLLFFMRSLLFSANHGLYTAITGGVMGYFIERKFRAPALSLFIGVPIAAFLHAMHNSGPAIIGLLGDGGALLYCCFLIPLFDYGGFIVIILLFIRAILRPRRQ